MSKNETKFNLDFSPNGKKNKTIDVNHQKYVLSSFVSHARQIYDSRIFKD